jgi:hypothetical protein
MFFRNKTQQNVMIKVLIGVLLVTTSALAQTTPQTAKTSSTKPTAASATARSSKPIPAPSQKDNLESKDNALPSYKAEKDAGKHKIQNRYNPRRTASGARKDTMLYRKQKDQ